MKRRFLASLAGLSLVWNACGAPLPLYENFGQVNVPPQIDATAFINAGTFNISTDLPFETQNTLYFTNRGTMTGSVGFRFEYSSLTGRQPASTFENQQTIMAEDSSSIFFSTSGFGTGGYLSGSYVLVSATNIVSPGRIGAGAGGLLRLAGRNLDLSNGGLSATAAAVSTSIFTSRSSIGLGYNGQTNYINPTDVSDLYWGIGAGNVLGGDARPLPLDTGLFTLPLPQSPLHQVVDVSGFTNEVMLPYFYSYLDSIYYGTNFFTNQFKSYAAYAFTNQPTATNENIQVVFVAQDPSGTNLNIQVGFAPGTGGDPLVKKAIVQFQLADVDVVTDTPITNYIYFMDDSASLTNSILKENLVTPTFRPSAYQVTRATPYEWDSTVSSNTAFNSSLLFNGNYTNNIVTNAYSAYSAQIGRGQDITSFYGSVYGTQYGNPALSDPTNYPGRVELVGIGSDPRSDQLDLTGARIRCEGLLTLKTKHLVSTAQSKIDAPLMSIDLGSTNETLLISNLFPNAVKRLKGQLFAWSGVWTNQRNFVITTNDPASTNSVSVTNTLDVRFHVLILDHSIQTVQPVAINEFRVQATNVVLADIVQVDRDFLVDAPSLTVQNQLNLPNGLGSTNLPRLLNLTNQGTIYIPLEGNFGADRAQRLNNLINEGTITGGGHQIKATNFFTGGFINYSGTNLIPATILASSGAIRITSATNQLNYGQLIAHTDVSIVTGDLLALYSTIQAGSFSVAWNGTETVSPGSLLLTVTNSLSDGGPGASNDWSCVGPFSLNVRPPRGDLLGTRLKSTAPKYAVVREVWSGEDRGPAPAGFTNNAALGWLILDGRSSSKFIFSGPGTNNALYVDYLELRGNATNFASALQIDPNMKLYFADANLPPEKLNGKLGGRLLWVNSFAGPNSSTNWVSASGQVFTVNRALLQSEDIDSDWDGIVNGLDSTPFYTVESAALRIGFASGPPPVALLSWIALAGATNALEFKADLSASVWQNLTNFVPSYPTHPVTVTDPLPGSGQRYYRVRVLTSQP